MAYSGRILSIRNPDDSVQLAVDESVARLFIPITASGSEERISERPEPMVMTNAPQPEANWCGMTTSLLNDRAAAYAVKGCFVGCTTTLGLSQPLASALHLSAAASLNLTLAAPALASLVGCAVGAAAAKVYARPRVATDYEAMPE